jgi:hypothetical protein
MKIHGKYCGPWWSEGKSQPSVVGSLPPDDEFDATCQQHDAHYALGHDLASADFEFARANLGKGWLPTAAAVGVGFQGVLRAADKYLPKFITKENMNNPRLRGSTKRAPVANSNKNKKKKSSPNGNNPTNSGNGGPLPGMAISRSFPSTSIGTTIRSSKPLVQRTTENARMVGRDFIGTVEGQGVSTFGLGKSALLSPAYFNSTVLGNLARSFERYRWNKLRICYVPKVATTATGQIILSSQRSTSEPDLQGEAGNFLPRAMSQGNAVFAPLWTPACIDIDCTGEFKLVDPSTTTDIDDCIHEELQVYTQVGSSGQVGYLYADYDVSFEEPIYQPHSTALPFFTGPGQRSVWIDTAAVNANNAALSISDSGTIMSTAVVGTVFRAVFDLQGSTAPTGITFASGFRTNTFGHDTTTTFTSAATTIPLIGGAVFYITKLSNTVGYVYTSLEAAVGGDGTGQLFYTGATTVVGAYNFDVAVVRLGTASLPVVQ